MALIDVNAALVASSLSSVIKSRIRDAVVYQNGYTDTIESNGEMIPNPLSKAQWFNRVFADYIKTCLKAVEANSAAESARQAKSAEIDALGIG